MDVIMGREIVEKIISTGITIIHMNFIKFSLILTYQKERNAYHLFSPDMPYSICLATERVHHNRVLDIRF